MPEPIEHLGVTRVDPRAFGIAGDRLLEGGVRFIEPTHAAQGRAHRKVPVHQARVARDDLLADLKGEFALPAAIGLLILPEQLIDGNLRVARCWLFALVVHGVSLVVGLGASLINRRYPIEKPRIDMGMRKTTI